MNHKLKVFIGIGLIISVRAKAEIKVKQSNSASKTVLLETTENTKVHLNSTLLLNLPEGKQCPLRVTNVAGPLISADSSECKQWDDIKKGQEAEVELMLKPKNPEPISSPSPAAVTSEEPSHRLHISTYLYLNSGNEISFDSITVSGGGPTATGSATFSTQGTGGLGFELWQSAPHSWGWSGGFSLESKRKINSATVTSAGVPTVISYTEPKATIAFWQIYGNALYRWENIYLPFGLNYSVPDYKSGATEAFSVSGATGFQVGVGYHFTESFSMEFYSRVTRFRVTGAYGPYSYDFKTGTMTSGQLNFRWDFY